jgi:hypothetical protein
MHNAGKTLHPRSFWRANPSQANHEKPNRLPFFLAAFFLIGTLAPVDMFAQALPTATHHVRPATQSGEAPLVGDLPANTTLKLDIVLRLRDEPGLDRLVKDIYTPRNPQYRRFLTVEQFTERFGPSQQDYDAVVRFAQDNGFTVTGGTREGMDVQVEAPVYAIQSAFHVNMFTYRHPTENRNFYAPDREPAVDLPFALWHISGLDNFSIPKPKLSSRYEYATAHGIAPEDAVSHATTGSGPSASYLGSDMRKAYYGSGKLTGAGQNLGLWEYAGTDLADLDTYYKNVHQTNTVPIKLFSVDGTSTACVHTSNKNTSCDDLEQTIDMTQALGMAPGLASLVNYIGSTDTAIASAMVSHSPLPTVIGCSWGANPADATVLDPYFKRMAIQGQNFLAASGDYGKWTATGAAEAYPADDDYVVSVGGTDLVTASAGGAWKSESAWVDSSGGVTPDGFKIPDWQHLPDVINPRNKGSVTLRNGPDVSANANWTFYVCADQTTCTANVWGGTSFAAPMWAGYLALINQQLEKNGDPTLGFINPIIYAQNTKDNAGYVANFHDITTGSNVSFSAVEGFDLVTGWGSPRGGLIDALAPSGHSLITIFKYDGTPCGSTCPGWKELDDDSHSIALAASDNLLYTLDSTGSILKWNGSDCSSETSCPAWEKFDDNPDAAAIASDGSNLYQLHYSGQIWKSTGVACSGSSCPGWKELDNNPDAIAISASGGNLFQLHANGQIWKSTGAACGSSSCLGWIELDNNPAAIAIASSLGVAYQLHDDGSIWKSTGAACSASSCPGWVRFDNNPAAVAIAVGDGILYQLHNDGEVWKSTGVACSGSSCPGWIKLDSNPAIVSIVAGGSNLYELHNNGDIWKSTGVACSGSSCPGWTLLDANAFTTGIAAGSDNLYELHGPR